MDQGYRYAIVFMEKDPTVRIQKVSADTDFLLFSQQTVRGYIECVYPRNLERPYVMLVNDCGLLMGQGVNPVGCWLYGTYDHGELIVGPVVICKQVMTDDGPDIDFFDDYEEVKGLVNKLGKWIMRAKAYGKYIGL